MRENWRESEFQQTSAIPCPQGQGFRVERKLMSIRYLSICSGIEAASAAWKGLDFEPAAFAEIEPFPCAVLKHHYPDVPNLGDITKIDGKNLQGQVDMIVGGTPCFPKGTKVLTPTGYRNIENIAIGDQVVSANGNICSVTDVGSKQTKIGKLEIEDSLPILCTPNHPFFCASKDYIHSSSKDVLKWTEAQNTVNHYIASLHTAYAPMQEIPNFGYANDADILELAGWYVANGAIFLEHKHQRQTKIEAGSKACYFAFAKRFQNIIPFSYNCPYICLEHPGIEKWLLDNLGEYHLMIPYWLYSHPLKSCFLDGFFGAMKTSCRIQQNESESLIRSDCQELMLGLADLLINESYLSMEMEEAKPGYFIPVYTLHIPHESKNPASISGRKLCKVKGYEIDSSKLVRVYNITVEKDHSYVVNGFAVHNCQDFSVAGQRKGLEGKRSGLAYEFIRLVSEINPKWFIWENVPGAFSTNQGRDFGCILKALDELRYGLAWRVLDAQHFGVPQRRRRIFLIGYLGDWRPASKVLFERESLCRNTQKSRKKRQKTAGNFGDNSQNGMPETNNLISFVQGQDGSVHINDIAPTLRCKDQYPSSRGVNFLYNKADDSIKSHWEGGPHPTLQAMEHGIGMSNQEIFSQKGACLVDHKLQEVLAIRTGQTSSNGHGIAQDKSHTLDTTNSQALIFAQNQQGEIHISEISGTLNQNSNATGRTQLLAYAPEILEQALTAKYAKGTSGPAGDEHHNLVCVAFAQNTRDEVRLQNGDGQISGSLGAREGMKQRTYLAVGDCSLIHCDKDKAVTQPNAITGTLMASGAGMDRPMGTPQESDMLVLHINNKKQEQNNISVMTAQQDSTEIGDNIGPAITAVSEESGNNQSVLFQTKRKIFAIQEEAERENPNSGPAGKGYREDNLAFTITSSQKMQSICGCTGNISNPVMKVRRITPTEAERLMGFPDGYTAIEYKGKPAADGQRYKALGNSMAVPVMRWLGERISLVDKFGTVCLDNAQVIEIGE